MRLIKCLETSVWKFILFHHSFHSYVSCSPINARVRNSHGFCRVFSWYWIGAAVRCTRKCHIKKLWHYLSRRTAVFFWLSRSLPRPHPARATRLFVIVEWLGIGRPPDRKHNGEMGQVATPRSIVAKVCSMGGENRKGQSHFSCVMASYEEE